VNVLLGWSCSRPPAAGANGWRSRWRPWGSACSSPVPASFPWIALTLAVSFSLYGWCASQVPVDGVVGLMVETLFLLPAAVVVLCVIEPVGGSAFGRDAALSGLLASSGGRDGGAADLLRQAVRRLRLTTVGFLQYLSPTVSSCWRSPYSTKPFTDAQLKSFLFIWAAIAISSCRRPLSRPPTRRRTSTRPRSRTDGSIHPHNSNSPAAPCPPPMHMVTTPYRFFAALHLVGERADQARPGHAERMADRDRPAVDVQLGRSMPNRVAQYTTCTANASFSSHRSMSSTFSPCRLSSLGTANTGPMPISSGSHPATANPRKATFGLTPSASARSRGLSSAADAPSDSCEAFARRHGAPAAGPGRSAA